MILEYFFILSIIFFMCIIFAGAMVKIVVNTIDVTIKAGQEDKPEDFDPDDIEIWQ